MAIILTIILAISIHSAIVLAKGKSEEPPGKPNPEIPLLKLNDKNIVTAEPDGDGRLRVWGYTSEDPTYENIWTAENVHYDSVAMGDVDNDPDTIEIVGTTGYRVTEGKGKSRTTYYKIFFNVYKPDESGVWKTSDHVTEDRVFWGNEIIIADVDPTNGNGNEVIMITPHWLAVYTYDEPAFTIMSSFNFPEASATKSVTVGDLDKDGNQEIIVSVIIPGSDHENEGYLYIFEYDNSNLNLLSDPTINDINARLNRGSLCVSDLGGDESLEICSTGYRKIGDFYEVWIFIWDDAGTIILEELLSELDSTIAPYWTLDVGQLDSDSYDEIALEIREPNRGIKLYNFDTTNGLEEICTIPIDDPSVIRGNVLIADSDGDGDNEIVAYGSARADPSSHTGRFYLEVFNYQEGVWSSIWSRVEGEYGEFEVWSAAVG